MLVSLGIDVRTRLRQSAERDAAAVFAANLKDLLLAAPAGGRPTLGLDPGFRTGVKVAVVDGTGKVVATDTIYPHQPANRWDQSLATLERLVEGATGSSWWPSATAPPPGRPTGWPPISSRAAPA